MSFALQGEKTMKYRLILPLRSTLVLLAGVALLLLCFSCASTAKSANRPLWAHPDTLEQAYPRATSIARLAAAATEKEAATLAEGELTAYFEHTVSIATDATQTLDSSGNTSGSLTKAVRIQGELQLFAVHKTEAWYDAASKRYFVCAYIDREEAWLLYATHIDSARASFSALYEKALSEPDAFKRLKLLHAAEAPAATFSRVLDFAHLLAPAHDEALSEDREHIASLAEKKTAARMEARMQVVVQNDSALIVERVISGALSKAGYYLSATDARYQVRATVSKNLQANTVDGETVYTAEPGITVALTQGDEILFSYNKTLARISGFSESVVSKKLYQAIERELTESFLKEFSAALE